MKQKLACCLLLIKTTPDSNLILNFRPVLLKFRPVVKNYSMESMDN